MVSYIIFIWRYFNTIHSLISGVPNYFLDGHCLFDIFLAKFTKLHRLVCPNFSLSWNINGQKRLIYSRNPEDKYINVLVSCNAVNIGLLSEIQVYFEYFLSIYITIPKIYRLNCFHSIWQFVWHGEIQGSLVRVVLALFFPLLSATLLSILDVSLCLLITILLLFGLAIFNPHCSEFIQILWSGFFVRNLASFLPLHSELFSSISLSIFHFPFFLESYHRFFVWSFQEFQIAFCGYWSSFILKRRVYLRLHAFLHVLFPHLAWRNSREIDSLTSLLLHNKQIVSYFDSLEGVLWFPTKSKARDLRVILLWLQIDYQLVCSWHLDALCSSSFGGSYLNTSL